MELGIDSNTQSTIITFRNHTKSSKPQVVGAVNIHLCTKERYISIQRKPKTTPYIHRYPQVHGQSPLRLQVYPQDKTNEPQTSTTYFI